MVPTCTAHLRGRASACGLDVTAHAPWMTGHSLACKFSILKSLSGPGRLFIDSQCKCFRAGDEYQGGRQHEAQCLTRLKGLHMEMAARIGVFSPSSPRYLTRIFAAGTSRLG